MTRGALLVGVALCLVGCMTYPEQDEGGVGIGLGEDGQPVVHFASCDSPVVEVVVLQGREGLAEDEENAVVGEWRLARPATQGFLDLANTAAEGEFLGFGDGVTYLVDVRLEDDNTRLAGAEFELSELDALGTDQVLAAEDRVVTVPELAGDCPTP